MELIIFVWWAGLTGGFYISLKSGLTKQNRNFSYLQDVPKANETLPLSNKYSSLNNQETSHVSRVV